MSQKKLVLQGRSGVMEWARPLLCALAVMMAWGWLGASEAQALRPAFAPHWGFSLSGGTTFYRGRVVNQGGYQDQPFTHGLVGLSMHYWAHRNVSLDLGVDAHLATPNSTGEGAGYLGIKPGIRLKFAWFYLRPALHFAVGAQNQPFLFGGLLGLGLRIPLGRYVRLFGEVNWSFLFGNGYSLPMTGKLGIEFVFPRFGRGSI